MNSKLNEQSKEWLREHLKYEIKTEDLSVFSRKMINEILTELLNE